MVSATPLLLLPYFYSLTQYTPLHTESYAENSSQHNSVDWSVDEDEEAFVRVHIRSQSDVLIADPPSGSGNFNFLYNCTNYQQLSYMHTQVQHQPSHH